MTAELGDGDVTELGPVAPGYRKLIRTQLALAWAPIAVASIVADQMLLRQEPVFGLPSVAVPLLALLIVATAPQKLYARLRYGLNDRLLQVVRGWLFQTDTVVPFVRVQHIDVTRGPLDKLFGTSTLIVHTAGTHNSIVTVPGLAPERAMEMRDVIRDHVRTDFG
jgi:uncharacterized protein